MTLTMVLMAGFSAYPQSTRTSREKKTEKTAVRKESTRRSEVKTQENAGQAKTQSRQQNATRTRDASQNQKQAETQVRNQDKNQDRNQAGKQSGNEAVTRSNRTRNTNATGASRSGAARITRSDEPAEVRIKSSSANRIYREDKGTLTRDDGTIFRHQNDQVFTKNKFKVDYDSYTTLRRSDDFRMEYRNYYNWYDNRSIRNISYNSSYRPLPLDMRRERYSYRQPTYYQLIWTPNLMNRFMYYYPGYTSWDFDYGNEIETISSYDVNYYVGTVKRVYGKVEEVYYSREDQNYILYLGARFPFHDLSIVIPRQVARQISAYPEWFFRGEYVWLVGLIELWEDKPEMVIRDEEQIRTY